MSRAQTSTVGWVSGLQCSRMVRLAVSPALGLRTARMGVEMPWFALESVRGWA